MIKSKVDEAETKDKCKTDKDNQITDTNIKRLNIKYKNRRQKRTQARPKQKNTMRRLSRARNIAWELKCVL